MLVELPVGPPRRSKNRHSTPYSRPEQQATSPNATTPLLAEPALAAPAATIIIAALPDGRAVGTRIQIFFALDPKLVPRIGNLRSDNSKIRETG
jgi:hypothetical protein